MTAPLPAEALTDQLAEHWWEQRGMSYGAPDRCACGAETRPERGDEDISVRRARAFAAHQAEVLAAHPAPPATVIEERRAPVNSAPYGTVAWSEHKEAWRTYSRRFGNDQSAQVIARRGGFGIEELTAQLGRLPETWQPNATTESWWRRFRDV